MGSAVNFCLGGQNYITGLRGSEPANPGWGFAENTNTIAPLRQWGIRLATYLDHCLLPLWSEEEASTKLLLS